MKSYGDEEIVKLLNQYKLESRGDVYSGIVINGDMYRFHEYKFCDEKVKIMLPLRFIDMPQDVLNIKYGHLPQVDIIKCSRDYNIDVMLNFTEQIMNENEIERNIDEQINLLKMFQPSYEIYEHDIEDNGYIKIGWFDYKANAMDIALYCINFIFQVEGRMVMGKFTCNMYKAQNWKSVFLKMLFSINNIGKKLKEDTNGSEQDAKN